MERYIFLCSNDFLSGWWKKLSKEGGGSGERGFSEI
jgi:hypothetical protein